MTTKARCKAHLDSAMVALQDMIDTLENDTPDAVLAFLEAAQDVHDSVTRAVTDAMCAIVKAQTPPDDAGEIIFSREFQEGVQEAVAEAVARSKAL